MYTMVQCLLRGFQVMYELLTQPRIRPHHILLMSVFFTSLHFVSYTDFGFTHEASHNFMIWHFVHRSYAHSLSNFLFLFLLSGSLLRISVADILTISGFVYCLGFFDAIPFYGSSGLVFLLVGRTVASGYLLESYPFLNTKAHVPYALPVILLLSALAPTTSLSTSVEILHLFSLFVGFLFVFPASEAVIAATNLKTVNE